MKVILFGATGMVGSGVLIECLDEPRIDSVFAVGRRSCGVVHPKLREHLLDDLFRLDDIKEELAGYDACFFCLGVSSAGMDEAAYRRITFDLTIAAATLLQELDPELIFCFVSGLGTDSTGRSRTMWARVKGETENRLLEMFPAAYMFRPGFIEPLKGVRSSTRLYRILYTLLTPILPLLRRGFPRHVTTTVGVGRAMIEVALHGYPQGILETTDINAAAEGGGGVPPGTGPRRR